MEAEAAAGTATAAAAATPRISAPNPPRFRTCLASGWTSRARAAARSRRRDTNFICCPFLRRSRKAGAIARRCLLTFGWRSGAARSYDGAGEITAVGRRGCRVVRAPASPPRRALRPHAYRRPDTSGARHECRRCPAQEATVRSVDVVPVRQRTDVADVLHLARNRMTQRPAAAGAVPGSPICCAASKAAVAERPAAPERGHRLQVWSRWQEPQRRAGYCGFVAIPRPAAPRSPLRTGRTLAGAPRCRGSAAPPGRRRRPARHRHGASASPPRSPRRADQSARTGPAPASRS